MEGGYTASRRKGWSLAAGAVVVFVAARAAAGAGVDHFATWSYQWSWYPFLLAVEGVAAGVTGRFALLSRPGFALSLWLWSVPVWFSFELLNLRLANWFYVGVPAGTAQRWTGYGLAFATVLPAIWLPLEILERAGVARELNGPSLPTGGRALGVVAATGLLFLVLPLWRPEIFYPLVWGAPALLLAPWNHRRDPSTSLLGELGRSRYGRLLRLLAAGLAAGVAWEGLNWYAGGRWIYTVPGLEEVKLFEMPVAGFLGFPAFAVECAVIYRALVNAGVAVPEKGGRIRARRTALAAVVAVGLSAAAAAAVDRWTVASTIPETGDLPAVTEAGADRLREAGIGTVDELARADAAALATRAGITEDRARGWIATASLADLRGMGAAGARALWEHGIREPCSVAGLSGERLAEILEPAGILGPPAAGERRARVWLRAAEDACTGTGPRPARKE